MRGISFSIFVASFLQLSCSSDSAEPGEGEGDTSSTGGSQTGDGDGDAGDGDASGDGDGVGGGGGMGSGGLTSGDGDAAGGSGGEAAVPEGSVPAFVAQGHAGRTVVSCDDGRTWVYDQSDDDALRCWSVQTEDGPQPDCDHDPGAGRGLAYGNGQFFAMFGWGAPSTLHRTENGRDWEIRIPASPEQRFGGVGYLNGTLLAAGISSRVSSDDGLTWSEPIPSGLPGGSVRRAGTAGQHFVIVSDEGIALSEDEGATWYSPMVLPTGCGGGIQTNGGIAYGNGVILILGGDGLACRSTDGGRMFASKNIGGSADSHLVWSGTDFVVYGGGVAYRSADGDEWTSTPMNPSLGLGPVAVSDTGTFVAVEGGWGDSVWYAGQEFFRSEDGINWEVLPATDYAGGHPMRTLAFGYVNPSEACQSL